MTRVPKRDTRGEERGGRGAGYSFFFFAAVEINFCGGRGVFSPRFVDGLHTSERNQARKWSGRGFRVVERGLQRFGQKRRSEVHQHG